MKSLKDLGEFGLIDVIKKISPSKQEVVKGIGDDAAVLPLDKKRYLLLTTDMLVGGVHFDLKENKKFVGRKALAVSISDIVAMGGVPKFAVASLGVPKNLCVRGVKNIYEGMRNIAKEFGVSVVGGDTVVSKDLVVNVALTGEVEKRHVVLRSGAKKGDKIFVTGQLGCSLKTKKHLLFTPKIKEAQCIVKDFKPTAMIDISDGLASDLRHILKESDVGAIIDETRIPCAKGASIEQAFCDGEDFELIFTLSAVQAKRFLAKNSTMACCIGEIVERKNGFKLQAKNGRVKNINERGYIHF